MTDCYRPLAVEHHMLTPSDRESNKLASLCPTCKRGTLGVIRSSNTLRLMEYDRCLLCGQVVRYIDIEDMRKKDWGGPPA